MRLLRDTCRSIRNQLPLHVGGDLDPEPARRVDEHLHRCLACFREYRALAAMRQRLGVLAEEQPPVGALDGFTEEVMARIALGERGPAAEPAGVRGARRSLVMPLAAAATLMVGVLLGQLARDRAPVGPSSLPTSVAAPTVAQTESIIPSTVSGSLVGAGTPARLPTFLDDFGVHTMSDEERTFLGSSRIPPETRLWWLLNSRRGGLSPESGRQLRPRALPEASPPDR